MRTKKVKVNKDKKNKIKVGIAFGGGGARGFAHLGALLAFEEEGIKFDEVAGTSVGSLVGALYSYGLTANEIIEIAKKLTAKEIKGKFLFSETTGVQDIIKNSIGDIHIEELKIPFTAVACDIKTGKEVHFTTGSVAKAVAASCAVPFVFKPVEYKNFKLFDGGLVNSVPADVLRNNGCNIVIAIDINHTRGLGTESSNIMQITNAMLGILMNSNAIKGKVFSNICLEPELKNFKSTKLDGSLEMIEIGYQEAKSKIPQIKELLQRKNMLTKLFTKNKSKILFKQKQEVVTI